MISILIIDCSEDQQTTERDEEEQEVPTGVQEQEVPTGVQEQEVPTGVQGAIKGQPSRQASMQPNHVTSWNDVQEPACNRHATVVQAACKRRATKKFTIKGPELSPHYSYFR